MTERINDSHPHRVLKTTTQSMKTQNTDPPSGVRAAEIGGRNSGKTLAYWFLGKVTRGRALPAEIQVFRDVLHRPSARRSVDSAEPVNTHSAIIQETMKHTEGKAAAGEPRRKQRNDKDGFKSETNQSTFRKTRKNQSQITGK